MESPSAFILSLVFVFPIVILVTFVRRRRQKKKYYADPLNEGPVEGTIDELNQVDPQASPWRNDQITKIKDTMDLVERYDTMRGYTENFVEDLKNELRKNEIACESVFLEGYPIGAFAALTIRMGIIDLYADRSQIERAKQVVREYQSR